MAPRPRLRQFVIQRFSEDGALDRLIHDHFETVAARVRHRDLEDEADSFVTALSDRGLMDRLWPALLAERPLFAEEIGHIQVAWNNAHPRASNGAGGAEEDALVSEMRRAMLAASSPDEMLRLRVRVEIARQQHPLK
jgi:hypothetical protein